jgi:hypothetical protein
VGSCPAKLASKAILARTAGRWMRPPSPRLHARFVTLYIVNGVTNRAWLELSSCGGSNAGSSSKTAWSVGVTCGGVDRKEVRSCEGESTARPNPSTTQPNPSTAWPNSSTRWPYPGGVISRDSFTIALAARPTLRSSDGVSFIC